MKKAIAILSVCVLSAALLAGCASSSSTSAGSASAAVSSAAASGASSAASSAGTVSYEKADLDQVLDACKSFEMDSAGGSLKSADAAAGLVEFSAKNAVGANIKALGDDVESWYNGLTDADKTLLKKNWSDIYQDAQAIVADPSSQAGLLSDAGVTTDFSKMDLSTGISVCNLLDSLMKNA